MSSLRIFTILAEHFISFIYSGVPAERVGEEAGKMLLDNLKHGGCVDEHLQDQVRCYFCLFLMFTILQVFHCYALDALFFSL